MGSETITKTETVIFHASGNVRLVRVPTRPLRNAQGDRVGQTEGLTYEFQPDGPGGAGGKLVVDDAMLERDRAFFAEHDPGFDGDPRTLEWLRGHPEFRKRFFEIPQAAPDPQETLSQVAAAAGRGDESALAELYEREERTHNRPGVLEPIKAALLAIENRDKAPEPEGGFRPPEPEE